ncbi:hypothetical protein Tco_1054961 [Tanacetum coccineum]|uniref:Uncharacterized protein n=1 Tax=Tanacetum coccineum TaxID=301880 RepID=A0ABQ5GYN3_9ASTR
MIAILCDKKEAIRLQTARGRRNFQTIHWMLYWLKDWKKKKTTKAQLKRYGEELQTEISKKQMIDDKDVSNTEEKVGQIHQTQHVLIIGTSQSRQHDKSEPTSYYLTD